MELGRGARVLALALVAAWIFSALLLVTPPTSGLTVRPGPIVIRSDAEFTPQNGVSGGTGTPSDPYRIEDLEITCCDVGIYVENTQAWFVIRNVRINVTTTGIHFFSLANGTIDNATVIWGDYAIRVQTSRNVAVLRSTIARSEYGASAYGIEVSGSEDVTIAGTSFSDLPYYGLALSYAKNVTVVGNRFTSTGIGLYGPALEHVNTHTITPDNLVNGKPVRYYRDCAGLDIDGMSVGQLLIANCTAVRVTNLAVEDTSDGIVLAFVDGAIVSHNNVSRSNYGLRLLSVSNATVLNNSFFENSETGVATSATSLVRIANNLIDGNRVGAVGVSASYSVSNTTIVGNEIARTRDTGVLVYSAHDVLVTRNNLTGNAFALGVWMGSSAIRIHQNNFFLIAWGTYDEPGSEVAWSDRYPRGGNFWSDYRGADRCSGPNQNVCPSSDGIGDTPYPVDADTVDRYPLMEPFDSQPPRTAANITGALGLAGWYRSPVTVTLSATDSGRGVASTTYQVDGGPWETYGSPFSIGFDDAHTLDYYSTDVAGNSEPPRSLDVRIDATAPGAAAHVDGTLGTSGWYVSEASVSLTATDAMSQVASIEYRLDSGAPFAYAAPVQVGDGTHRLEFWATDIAGNLGPAEGLDLRIDTAAPVTDAALLGTAGSGGWYRSTVSVALVGNDAASGVASISYQVDGGAVQAYVSAFTVGTGEHHLEFWATDVAGNTEAHRSRTVRVDAVPPEFGPTGPSNVVTRTDVTVAWSATDAVSGIDRYEASVDGGAYDDVGLAQSLAISLPDGLHQVRVRAIDRAGNAQDIGIVFRVDANPFSPTGPYGGVPSYVLLVAGAGAATAYVWRRRRRGRAKE